MAATTDANGGRDTDGASDSDHLSPEDAAWVDSCLVNDNDDHDVGYLSDESWATLTEAFISALASASGAGSVQRDEDEAGESSSTTDAHKVHSPVNASGEEVLMSEAAAADDFQASVFEEASSPTASGYAATFSDQPAPTLGDSGDGLPTLTARFNTMFAPEEGNGSLGAGAAAVVTGNEYPDEKRYGDVGDGELSFPNLLVGAGKEVDDVELTKDVFRVWDLDVPHEEDENEQELSWQLKKALEGEGNSVGAMMPTPLADDRQSSLLEEWKDDDGNADWDGRRLDKPIAVLDDHDLEELITGIGDMSLRPSSS